MISLKCTTFVQVDAGMMHPLAAVPATWSHNLKIRDESLRADREKDRRNCFDPTIMNLLNSLIKRAAEDQTLSTCKIKY